MNGLRCFVAVDLPESMRDEIGRIEEEIRLPGLRLVKPELCHATLKFLGDVPEERIVEISRALQLIESEPFTARVSGIGAFPRRSIRVVWLGLQGDFGELHQKVEDALSPFGFEREGRAFTPHVTLARVGRPSQDSSRLISQRIDQLAKIDLGSFSVDSFFLKKSTLARGGPLYEDIAEFLLRPQR